jgi:hypothetical protein
MAKKKGERNKILANVATKAEADKITKVPKGYERAVYSYGRK